MFAFILSTEDINMGTTSFIIFDPKSCFAIGGCHSYRFSSCRTELTYINSLRFKSTFF